MMENKIDESQEVKNNTNEGQGRMEAERRNEPCRW